MATDFTIDTDLVTSTANEIQKQQSNMNNIIQDAQGTLSSLASVWQGEAADTYAQTFATMKGKLDDANQIISTYIQFLQQTVTDYTNTENQNQTDDSSFEGGN